MRRILLAAAVLSSIAAPSAYSQEETKTGWNFAPLPAVTYSTDLGFQYGVNCQMFCYGDGSIYPDYLHKFDFEVSRYTKGSTVLHAFYDSKHLIPGIRLTTAASYITSTMYPFYGFNGTSSPWFQELDANKDQSTAFYNIDRKMLRLLADFQGRITGSWNWIGGLSFCSYRISDISNSSYSSLNTLYRSYLASGLIDQDQASGGSHIEFKGSISYDTRDHESAPAKGISAEVYLYGSPDFFNDWNDSYLKMAAHFRQYIPVKGDRIVFAYHLAYQGLVAGEAPFYTLQNINVLYLRQTTSDGLGSRNTIRGTLYNRFVGNGYAWSNFEFRIRLFSFNLIRQHWYVATNPFFDAGKIVQPYRLGKMKSLPAESSSGYNLIYSGLKDKVHCSSGLGLQLVMNRNFIISAEFGKTFRSEDGNSGFNLGLNYIF